MNATGSISGMKLSVSLPERLVAGLDERRGLVPRSTWIAWAVEQVLNEVPPSFAGMPVVVTPDVKPGQVRVVTSSSTPAEPPSAFRGQPGPNVENLRSSAQAKRAVRPIPKGGG